VTAGLFPTFLKLAGRKVVVVGAGPVGASKIDSLLAAGAEITVVAPDVSPAVAAASVRIERRRFEPADLDGAWFVVAAAPPDVNRAVRDAADARHVFVNAVDDPPNATAYLGGVVRKRGVTVAISTDGSAPALAGLLREGLETLLPDDVEAWLEVSRRAREHWKRAGVPMEERRPLLLDAINRLYERRREPAVAGAHCPPLREGLQRDLDEARAKSGVRPDEVPV
jgi:uroporphyrin-III C-methyltransferase/precorrin-2 dehydrogenase/sirohydrochlorin ferrochelatase